MAEIEHWCLNQGLSGRKGTSSHPRLDPNKIMIQRILIAKCYSRIFSTEKQEISSYMPTGMNDKNRCHVHPSCLEQRLPQRFSNCGTRHPRGP
ncbi:hypothetical protein TNCV_954011 [Trichonephila clavipes]|nr:hypothetical protein TNCV_954011 [Trichonephila clavipes]